MADLSRSHGVDYTVVKNLTGETIFLSWFPTQSGHGIQLGPHARVRFSGNLFEAVVGFPDLNANLQADVQGGRIAVAVCGDDPEEYDIINQQVFPELAQWACQLWSFASSSSIWQHEGVG